MMLEGRLSDQAMEHGELKTTENITNQISLFAVTQIIEGIAAFTANVYITGRTAKCRQTQSVEQTKYLHTQNHI